MDVERVIASVRLLARRGDIDEISPFVALWHPAVDRRDRQPNVVPAFDQAFRDALGEPPTMHQLEHLLGGFVDARTGRSVTGKTYSALAELMVDRLRLLIQIQPKATTYLRPLVEMGRRPGGITIATLNYDRSIEIAAETAGVPLTTGLDDWYATGGAWVWGHEGVRLLKLHGSIDWVWRATQPDGSPHLPRRNVVVAQGRDAGEPGMVFGRGAKLDARGPFLGLLAQFEQLIAAAKRLLVIGYSFRDDHVNEIIRRWLTDDASHHLVVVDPRWNPGPFPTDQSFAAELAFYLEPSGSSSGPSHVRITVVQEKCGRALEALQSDVA